MDISMSNICKYEILFEYFIYFGYNINRNRNKQDETGINRTK